jgi:hypothetical protein
MFMLCSANNLDISAKTPILFTTVTAISFPNCACFIISTSFLLSSQKSRKAGPRQYEAPEAL